MADHHNIILQDNTLKFFIKEFFSEEALLKELNGYEIVAKYFPVPKLLNKYSCQKESRLVFEFEESIGLNKGLLIDVFNKTNNAEEFNIIFDMYKSVFNITLKKKSTFAADIFYRDRALKLREKYRDLCADIIPFEIVFKGVNLLIYFEKVIKSLENYFADGEHCELWSIISQADPSDLNIGTKPIILDYLGGGRVPLMAEFANIIWEQIAQSVVLAPIYNPKMYVDHDLVYANVPKILLNDGVMEFIPQRNRILFLDEYTKRVIMPLMERINYPDWYNDFKNHIAMRIIGVFDINKFSHEHKLLALGYLGLFYNVWNPETPLELIELIKK